MPGEEWVTVRSKGTKTSCYVDDILCHIYQQGNVNLKSAFESLGHYLTHLTGNRYSCFSLLGLNFPMRHTLDSPPVSEFKTTLTHTYNVINAAYHTNGHGSSTLLVIMIVCMH